MNNELILKLDEIIKDLNNTVETKRINELKSILLNDKDLLDDINSIKNSDYSDTYVNKKKELLDNNNYKEYKELEEKFYYFSKEVSSILSSIAR